LQVAEGTHLGLLQVFTTPSVPLVGNRNPQGRRGKPPYSVVDAHLSLPWGRVLNPLPSPPVLGTATL